MGIRQYSASADTTIVNAYEPNLRTRATGANGGLADVVEVYSVYGRQTTSSQELSRVLIQFPISKISSDRTAGTIPVSSSVNFYLRMFNAEHSKTVAKDYKLVIAAVSQSWQEGVGLDLERYKDKTKGNSGANWMSASNTTAWTSVGGDYVSSSGHIFKQTFSTGLEDLEINITDLVERWIAETDVEGYGVAQVNYGVGIHLSSSYEAQYSSSVIVDGWGQNSGSVIHNPDGATKSYYTKRFFGRGSQYFFKRPTIEARWNSATKDDRGNFYYSSSLAPGTDNLNTIYLYNYVRGKLTNIPDLHRGLILVSLYSGSNDNSAPFGSKLVLHTGSQTDGHFNVTGGYVSTGIYSASIATTAAFTPLTALYDVWHSGNNVATTTGVEYFTGSITPVVLKAAQSVSKPTYYLNITNLRDKYRTDETARFSVYIRDKNWNPTVYTVANTNPESTTITSASYRVFRLLDGYEAVSYGTGPDLHTQLSYDISGNYFDFDMKLLEPGYAYAFKLAFYDSALVSWVEQPEVFKFRVEDYEY